MKGYRTGFPTFYPHEIKKDRKKANVYMFNKNTKLDLLQYFKGSFWTKLVFYCAKHWDALAENTCSSTTARGLLTLNQNPNIWRVLPESHSPEHCQDVISMTEQGAPPPLGSDMQGAWSLLSVLRTHRQGPTWKFSVLQP